MNTENKQVVGGGKRAWNNMWKELRGTNLQLLKKESHGEAIYNIRNMVNNIVISLYGDRWLLNLLWSFHNVHKCQIAMQYIEPDLELCVNYISIRNQGLKWKTSVFNLKET